MYTLKVRNVNHALPLGLSLLRDHGARIAPRGLATLELPGVVATVYANPHQMVLFDQGRDANPFFHFFEALWILRGRKDVKFLEHFNAKMAEYSDDGETFHAPYGHRMRSPRAGADQIEACIAKLKADPDSRQCVISIWDDSKDWARTKDVPCNDMLMFKIRDGRLRMTVCNRSNDVVWGAYGANVVQFSSLLLYMAGRIGVDVGEYTQISDSYHVYEENPYWLAWLPTHRAGVPPINDPYENDEELNEPTLWMLPDEVNSGWFDTDLAQFFEGFDANKFHPDQWNYSWRTASFTEVAWPMWITHQLWRRKEVARAMGACAHIAAPDWRKACREWMQRRTK